MLCATAEARTAPASFTVTTQLDIVNAGDGVLKGTATSSAADGDLSATPPKRSARCASQARTYLSSSTKTYFCTTALARLVLLAPITLSAADAGPNLVPDASFESPVAAWFAEDGKGSYFAGKENVAGAADGKTVLAVEGWDKVGSKIFSPVVELSGDTFSGACAVRSFGAAGATVELALFDRVGKTKLASFGDASIDGGGKWSVLSAAGVKLAAAASGGRLALIVAGPQKGARAEIDRVALWAGAEMGEVADNADFAWFEAEELADGKAWKVVDHYPGWYGDLPVGMKMLAGFQTVAESENIPVTKALTVRFAGRHRLWARVMHTNPGGRAKFTVALRQAGQIVASREIDSGDPALGADFSWVFVPLDAELAAGPVEVMLSRPAGEASWIARKLDLFALTNLLDYQPNPQDFRPRGYLRFTNLTEDPQPLCLFTFVHRTGGPIYYVTPGMLGAAGFSGGHAVPEDREKWLAAGQSSPWVKMSSHLLASMRNNVQFLATRATHTEGFPAGRFRGRLEFAAGEERRVVKTIEIDQAAPRLLMTLPHDFTEADQIRSALDYVGAAEAAVALLPPTPGPVAKHLDLTTIVALDARVDDPRVVEREIAIIKRLGFNATYLPVTDPQDAPTFNERHGLHPRLGTFTGLGYVFRNGCPHQPDMEKMEVMAKAEAVRFGPAAEKLVRFKLIDEPGGTPYEHIVACGVCGEKFRGELRARGGQPQDFGVAAWEAVAPVGLEGREKQPALFYETALFRLRAFAEALKTCVEVKRRHFPPGALTFVNYSPPGSWVAAGTDPFFAQRDALEMGWSEDWLGYGAGPQQASETFAFLRAAGRGQPIGAYAVPMAGGPLLQRLKWYELLAAGVRSIDAFAYGPIYGGADSWSAQHELYPVLSEVLHEFGAIDDALHGTARRKTEIAILYNRTAGIWAGTGSTPQQEACFTRWALIHGGYDADFLPEEDTVVGKLAAYKVLYLGGPQLRRDAAQAISEWVREGGVLFGSAGAGSRDEHDQPLATLNEVFGAESRELKFGHDIGRPKYELRGLPVLDVLSPVEADFPKVELNQLCYREHLAPAPGATVILQRKGGEAAGVLNSFGKGRAVRVAAVPGITYVNDAVRSRDYDIESYLPRNYRPELRAFLTWPAHLAGVPPIATSTAPLLEVTRYDADNRSVIFLIDHSVTPQELTLTLPQAAQFTHAFSARGKPVRLKPRPNGVLEILIPLNVTDAVVLSQEPAATEEKKIVMNCTFFPRIHALLLAGVFATHHASAFPLAREGKSEARIVVAKAALAPAKDDRHRRKLPPLPATCSIT